MLTRLQHAIILSIIALSPALLAITPDASTRTETVYVSRDAVVCESDPDSNFGGLDWILAGRDFSDDQLETYLYFSIPSTNAKLLNATMGFRIYYVTKTMNLSICTTTTAWNEYTITWNNKPAHDTHLGYWVAATENWYVINVRSLVKTSNMLSFCLHVPSVSGYAEVQGNARESGHNAAQIYLEYEYVPPITAELVIMLVIAVVGASVAIIYFVMKQKGKRETENPKHPTPKSMQASTIAPIQNMGPIKFCPYCGKPVEPTTDVKFCKYCGNLINP